MITKKFVEMLVKPMETFRSVYREPFQDTLLFASAVFVLQLITSIILNMGHLSQATTIFANWVMGMAMFFVMAGLFHIFVMLARKGTRLEDYASTFKVIIYASVPFVLLGWIPFIALPATIWFIYLMVAGFAGYYRVGLARSLAVVFLPYIILYALAYVA